MPPRAGDMSSSSSSSRVVRDNRPSSSARRKGGIAKKGRGGEGGGGGNNNNDGGGATVSEFLDRRLAMTTTTTTTTRGDGDVYSADHPSSLEVLARLTCSLCLRTLPRSQFSEGSYGVNPVVNACLSPGVATCRTCTMTVCAAKIRRMPDARRLLLEWGGRRGTAPPPPPRTTTIAGYLGNGPDDANTDDDDDDGGGGGGGGLAVAGRELVASTDGGRGMACAMADVNSVFYGAPYGGGRGGSDDDRPPDVDRPSNVADGKYLDTFLSMPSFLNLGAFGVFGSSRDVSVSVAALEAVRLYGTLSGGGIGGGGGGYFVPHDCDGRPVVAAESESCGRNEKARRRRSVTNEDEVAVVDPRSVVCLVLGEGHTPRTAILASQHYGWTTFALDPTLSDQWIGRQDDVPDYFGYAGSLHDFMEEGGIGAGGGGRDRGRGGKGGSFESSTRFGHPRDGVPVRHLVVIGMMPHDRSEPVRMTGNGDINEVRSMYDDVPTTLVSLSPVRGATLAPPGAELRFHSNRLQRDLGYAPNRWYVDDGVFSECREVKVWNFHNTEDDDDCDANEDGDDNCGNGDVTDVKEAAAKGRGHEENDNTEKERRNARKGTKKCGSIVPEKKGIDARQPAPGGRKGDRPGNMKNETKTKKNEWLEEQVKQFQKQLKMKNVHPMKNDAGVMDDELDDDISFDDTLSTKEGYFFRKPSREVVDRPGGIERLVRKSSPEKNRIARSVKSEGNANAKLTSPDKDRIVSPIKAKGNADSRLVRKSSSDKERIASPIKAEGNADSLTPQEVDKVLDIISKHEEQQWQEHVRIDGSQRSFVEFDGENTLEASLQNNILPVGWEAILDPASGDYYYTNWDTSEVTWERPGTSPGLLHGEEPSYAATDNNNATDTLPVMSHQRSHEVLRPGEDNDSAQVLDDDCTVNSGIAALNRWNEPIISPTMAASVGASNGRLDDDRDMLAWSDEEDDDEFDLNHAAMAKQRRRSNPWHRGDDDQSLNSFVYD